MSKFFAALVVTCGAACIPALGAEAFESRPLPQIQVPAPPPAMRANQNLGATAPTTALRPRVGVEALPPPPISPTINNGYGETCDQAYPLAQQPNCAP